MRLLGSEKADAEVVGHVIILGLTITGIAMITLVGMPVIYRLQDMASIRDIEQTYTLLDSRVSKVALGESQRQIIDINLDGGSLSVIPNSSSESYVLIELKNATEVITRIPIPMGKIVYRIGDREVAYEGGGVWSKYPTGSVMLSPPEFNYNGITMTFPIINISGNSYTGGKEEASLNIEKKGNAQIMYPTATYRNPISENVTQVNITIKSEYFDAWADYFKSIALVRVNTVPSQKTTIITLETPPLITNFSYGALASNTITMGNSAVFDSYNSSKGNYTISKSDNGTIRANIDIHFNNNPQITIKGNAMSGGTITGTAGKGLITKNAYSTPNTVIPHNGAQYPAVEKIAIKSTTSLVQSKINEYMNSNNNSATACISNTALSGVSPCTIFTGNYYFTEFEQDGTLKFDTSTGPVNIAVADELEISGTIVVSGNNPVTIYLSGEMEVNNGNVSTDANQTSSLFQVISNSNQDISFNNGQTKFIGFVYAPFADIHINQGSGVYGAMVGKLFDVGQSQNVHFDEALQNLDTNVGSGTTVMYIYVTRNDAVASIN